MDLDKLKKAGAFVSDKPVEKTVVWERKRPVPTTDENGKNPGDKGWNPTYQRDELEFTVSIKPLAYGEFERLVMHRDPEAPQRSTNSLLISECVYFGGEQMTYEQAYQLKPGLANAIVAKVNEVNRGSETPGEQ